MTKINDYLWHLPHDPLPDDPPDVGILASVFNRPIVDMLKNPLGSLGYDLSSNDVMVRLDDEMERARTAYTYYANVRFIAYIEADIIVRVHFEHAEWANFLEGSERHSFYINLDRFKVRDPASQIAVPAWHGRLHSRMSNQPGDVLHHSGGEEQVWTYTSQAELIALLDLFLDKFQRLGHPWLADRASY
jgi:hypothetical protein